MLVFNCTKAATEFFTVIRNKKKKCFVEKPQSKVIADDAQWLHYADGSIPNRYSQWVLNVVTIDRKKVVFAMELESRYCMAFPGLKKGDKDAFLMHFSTRLLNTTMQLAVEQKLISASEASFREIENAFLEQHPQPCFLQRSDPSVIAHLKDAAWRFEGFCYNHFFPSSYDDCMDADEFMNCTILTTKASRLAKEGGSEYFWPLEVYFASFMKNYLAATPQAVQKFKKSFKHKDPFGLRSFHQEVPEEIQEELPLTGSNILSLDEFRKKQQG